MGDETVPRDMTAVAATTAFGTGSRTVSHRPVENLVIAVADADRLTVKNLCFL